MAEFGAIFWGVQGHQCPLNKTSNSKKVVVGLPDFLSSQLSKKKKYKFGEGKKGKGKDCKKNVKKGYFYHYCSALHRLLIIAEPHEKARTPACDSWESTKHQLIKRSIISYCILY
jgi:hypothetical protein